MFHTKEDQGTPTADTPLGCAYRREFFSFARGCKGPPSRALPPSPLRRVELVHSSDRSAPGCSLDDQDAPGQLPSRPEARRRHLVARAARSLEARAGVARIDAAAHPARRALATPEWGGSRRAFMGCLPHRSGPRLRPGAGPGEELDQETGPRGQKNARVWAKESQQPPGATGKPEGFTRARAHRTRAVLEKPPDGTVSVGQLEGLRWIDVRPDIRTEELCTILQTAFRG